MSSVDVWPSSCSTAAPRTLPAVGPREALPEARNLAQLDARAEHREQQGIDEDPDQAVIHLVVEAGSAGRVGARHPSFRLRLEPLGKITRFQVTRTRS